MSVATKQFAIDPFQAIADTNRREILKLISKNSSTINALAENFDMSRPAVSKHIKILWGAGLISIEERGRERYCSLRQNGFRELKNWMDYYESFWNNKLDALGKFLSETNSTNKKQITAKRK